MMNADELSEVDRSFIEFFVEESAARHMALYEVSGQGLLIWKAYAEYRQWQLPVPEKILAKLDEFGSNLQSAEDLAGVAKALELSGGGKGGPQRATLLRGLERSRDIVEAFRDQRIANRRLPKENQRAVKELAQRVGDRFGISADEVQSRYSQWKRRHAENDDNLISDLMKVLATKT